MHDIIKIHNEVYDLLMAYRKVNPFLYFTFRRSNRDGKLDKGYWFYGNEWYLAVSFWTGMDWKNKTPNIIFVILLDSGETYLEINTSDSDIKRKFINQYLVDALNLITSGQRYRKIYNENYLDSLKLFLNSDKILIDKIIEENSRSFFGSNEAGIFFIDQTDFEDQNRKIDRYRSQFNQENNSSIKNNDGKSMKISRIRIENYGPIKKIEIEEIPFSSQWVFFTGENGTGKTSILRAIATSLCFRKISFDELFLGNPFKTSLTLYLSKEQTSIYERFENNIIEQKEPLTSGFAGYGQSRLKTNHSGLSGQVLKNIQNDSLVSSLFDEDTYLIDLHAQFDTWRSDKANESHYNGRRQYITEILTDILPNLYDINFDDIINDIPATSYIEKDHEGSEFRKVTFDKLASGLKSMIAMIGDILARLYNQQPKIQDPAEFTGVVLIDEIDIHLHPKLQKLIVQQLTKTFPKIQFIATTHSPVPFLGAPVNSQIFKVERTANEGVQVKRLDQLLVLGDLLPNTILTSPIFGLDDIVPESHDPKNLVRTENSYEDIQFDDLLRSKISNFINDTKEQQLIALFKSRRE